MMPDQEQFWSVLGCNPVSKISFGELGNCKLYILHSRGFSLEQNKRIGQWLEPVREGYFFSHGVLSGYQIEYMHICLSGLIPVLGGYQNLYTRSGYQYVY
jgi:hypothetical protein